MPELMQDMADSVCEQLSCSAAERAGMNAALARAGGAGAAPND